MIQINGTDWYFMPDDRVAAHAAVLSIIAAAHSLLVKMYVLTDPAVITAIEAAKGRGGDVRVLLDDHEAKAPDILAVAHKLAGSVPVRIVCSPLHGALMHEKTLIADTTVISGSTNQTPSGYVEVNTLTITTSPDLAAAMTAQFETLWASGVPVS